MLPPAVVAPVVLLVTGGTQWRVLAFRPLVLGVAVLGEAVVAVAARPQSAVYAGAKEDVAVAHG